MEKKDSNADLAKIICRKYLNDAAALIEILHDVQEHFGFLPRDMLPEIAGHLNITRAEAGGVAGFYEDFRTRPPARMHLKICRGEACQSMGANGLIKLVERLKRELEGEISFEEVFCLGNCALAPAIMEGERLTGRVDESFLETRIRRSTGQGPVNGQDTGGEGK